MFPGKFEPPSFRQALARKDIALANELARELNVPMPVANIVEQLGNPVRQPRLGKHGHARDISPARGRSRRGDQVVLVRAEDRRRSR